MKSAREPASSRPKPCASLNSAPRILPVRRSLLALVGRRQTVFRDQLSSRTKTFGFAPLILAHKGSAHPWPVDDQAPPPPSPNLVDDRRSSLLTRYSTAAPFQAFRDTVLVLILILIVPPASFVPLIQIYTIQYKTRQDKTIQYQYLPKGTKLELGREYNTIQYNTIQYNTIQYNTIPPEGHQVGARKRIQYNTIQYNTIQYLPKGTKLELGRGAPGEHHS